MVGECGTFRVVVKGTQRFSRKKTQLVSQLVSWIPINVQYPCIVTEKSHVIYNKVFRLNGWGFNRV